MTLKKVPVFFLFLLLLLFLPAVGTCGEPPRALFVSVIQKRQVFSNREEIGRLIAYAREARFSVLFIQIYRANQSWFPSERADQTPYAASYKQVGEDPFALLIRLAHAEGIQVHAWVNLLSLSANSRAPILRKFGTDILTRNSRKKESLTDYKIDDQYFLEPGDPRVREELTAIVQEILVRYPGLDGIQFDYIRYPDVHPFYGHTPANISRFKKATGSTSVSEDDAVWKHWKRRQVTELLGLLAARARQLRPAIQVSSTACVPYCRAYDEAFQDWPLWLTTDLVDFVTLMTYPSDFGEFSRYIAEARSKVPSFKNVIIAVGAYKLLKNPAEFSRQLRACEAQQCKACAVLHYGSLMESEGLRRVLSGEPLR